MKSAQTRIPGDGRTSVTSSMTTKVIKSSGNNQVLGMSKNAAALQGGRASERRRAWTASSTRLRCPRRRWWGRWCTGTWLRWSEATDPAGSKDTSDLSWNLNKQPWHQLCWSFWTWGLCNHGFLLSFWLLHISFHLSICPVLQLIPKKEPKDHMFGRKVGAFPGNTHRQSKKRVQTHNLLVSVRTTAPMASLNGIKQRNCFNCDS